MAPAQFWHPECGGQSVRRAHLDGGHHLAPATARCPGVSDGGLRGGDLRGATSLALGLWSASSFRELDSWPTCAVTHEELFAINMEPLKRAIRDMILISELTDATFYE